jgi:hypothetical protein
MHAVPREACTLLNLTVADLDATLAVLDALSSGRKGGPIMISIAGPAYKNRLPMPGDTPVWRYLTLSAVIATIKTRQLR